MLIGLFQKRSTTHPQRKFLPSKEGGGKLSKNVLNLYRMSGKGEGDIVNFLRGGGVSFLK